jgi:CoA-transferase family III
MTSRFEWPARDFEATGPLAGFRILDLSAFAVGPYAASLIAMLGADVVKIDPPYGDPIRNVKPERHGEGTTFTVCNLGKRRGTVTLVSSALGTPAPDRLVADHDATCQHQLLDLTKTQREPKVQPEAVVDDLDRVAVALVRRRCGAHPGDLSRSPMLTNVTVPIRRSSPPTPIPTGAAANAP